MNNIYKLLILVVLIAVFFIYNISIENSRSLTDSDIWDNIQKYQKENINNDKLPPIGAADYLLVKGNRNVLLSAPHATNQMRENATKLSDYCTGPIVRVLGDLTNVSVIYTNYKSWLDPNYYDDVDYKNAIANISLEIPFIVLLDIHGAAEERDFDIDFGTMNNKSLLDKTYLFSELQNSFNNAGIAKQSLNYFSAEYQQTVTKFSANKLNVPSIQLEINRKYRCDNEENTIKLVRAIENYINLIS